MYHLDLSGNELKTLAWLTDRGYFPEELYDNMSESGLAIDETGNLTRWNIDEHAAWTLLELRDEDPDAYLACCGEPLLSKILELETNIV